MALAISDDHKAPSPKDAYATTATPADDAAREVCLATAPPDLPMYAENFMLACYDAAADVGMWLHLGTWPEDFGIWEDLVLLSLPASEDVLCTTGYRRVPQQERPAGPQLSFTCVEPFRRWRVDYDGLATRSTRSALAAGLLEDGQRERVELHLDVECVTPVWDGASSTSGGSMADQVWASDHYQQLLQVTGKLVTRGQTLQLSTTGVRDHSRGQRGHAMNRWGGHTLVHLLFPSGRAVGVQRMYDVTGNPSFDMAYVLIDGVWSTAEVLHAPRVHRPAQGPLVGDEPLVLEVRAGDRVHRLTGELLTAWHLTPHGLGMGIGTGAARPYGLFMPGHARWTWDGEISHGLTERSYGVAGSST